MQQAAAVLRGNHVTCRLSGTEFESDSVIISVTAITVKRCGPQSDTSDSSRTEARGKKSIKASCQDEEWRLCFHLDVRSGSNIRTCSRCDLPGNAALWFSQHGCKSPLSAASVRSESPSKTRRAPGHMTLYWQVQHPQIPYLLWLQSPERPQNERNMINVSILARSILGRWNYHGVMISDGWSFRNGSIFKHWSIYHALHANLAQIPRAAITPPPPTF